MNELDLKIEGVEEDTKKFIKTKPHTCNCDGNCGDKCKCKEKENNEKKRETADSCSCKR